MSDKALVPLNTRTVIFYEDELIAALVEVEGEDQPQIYVPIRPIAEYLGLTWSSQFMRINRDPVLSESVRSVLITRTEDTGSREMVCLPLKHFPGWMFGISATRVRPELKEKVIRYQRECFDVLWEAFQEGRLTADPTLNELVESGSDAAQAYQMALAVVKLARNQLLIEGRLGNVEQRLEQIEATLGDPGRYVTPEQASQISQAVKAIAMQLSKKTGRNEYGGVYGEFYRRLGITSYKMLPSNQFERAMKFLQDWHQSLVSDSPF
ncbi:MAG: phage antirepressor N-terminal domain-containing protein [Chloroflexota bacterium]